MSLHFDEDQLRTGASRAGSDATSLTTPFKVQDIKASEVAQRIDHTLLKLEATSDQIDRLCQEAKQHEFKSVCVRLHWVDRAVRNLKDSAGAVAVACVVGFHEGNYRTAEKVNEAMQAVSAGAAELDMVMNYDLLKDQMYDAVFEDIVAIRNACPSPVILKVILETSQTSPEEIVAACKIAEAAKADYVKTSTGFRGGGATVAQVRLMKLVVGNRLKVKASGGVKTLEDCVAMMNAGADRIGTSGGVAIVKEAVR